MALTDETWKEEQEIDINILKFRPLDYLWPNSNAHTTTMQNLIVANYIDDLWCVYTFTYTYLYKVHTRLINYSIIHHRIHHISTKKIISH